MSEAIHLSENSSGAFISRTCDFPALKTLSPDLPTSALLLPGEDWPVAERRMRTVHSAGRPVGSSPRLLGHESHSPLQAVNVDCISPIHVNSYPRLEGSSDCRASQARTASGSGRLFPERARLNALWVVSRPKKLVRNSERGKKEVQKSGERAKFFCSIRKAVTDPVAFRSFC